MDDHLDLERLNQFLSSDDSPEDSMMLSYMDGFRTGFGLICTEPKLL